VSIKAMTWAFDLPLEPRAKIALLAIADHAGDDGVAWPSRDLIAQKSSQSRATVNRRMAYLTELGVLTVHERFREDGSQTTDEIRLNLTLTADEIRRRLDADGGCQVAAPPVQMSTPGAADVTPPGTHCGNPQSEPSVEPVAVAVDARASLISRSAMELAEQLLTIAGHDKAFWPPGWCGAPMRVQTWLNEGWPVEIIIAATRASAARKTGPPAASVQFFEKAIAEEVARQAAPLPIVEIRPAQTIRITENAGSQGSGNIIQAAQRLVANLDGFDDGPDRCRSAGTYPAHGTEPGVQGASSARKRAHQLGLSCYLPTLSSRREIRSIKAGYEWIERKQVSPLITGAILVPDFDRSTLRQLERCGWHLRRSAVRRLRAHADAGMLTDIRRIEAIGNTPRASGSTISRSASWCAWSRGRSRTSRPASSGLTQQAESVLVSKSSRASPPPCWTRATSKRFKLRQRRM
jgi:hypothetical protein